MQNAIDTMVAWCDQPIPVNSRMGATEFECCMAWFYAALAYYQRETIKLVVNNTKLSWDHVQS